MLRKIQEKIASKVLIHRHMDLLVDDIVKTHPFFKHIIPDNILIAISPSNGNKTV